MSFLLYQAADTIDVPLHGAGNALWGKDMKKVKIGPFDAEMGIEAFSNMTTEKEVGLFLRFTSKLWAYQVIRHHESLLYFFDATELKTLGPKTAFEFGQGSNLKALIAIGPHVRRVFRFEKDAECWTELMAEEMAQEIPI